MKGKLHLFCIGFMLIFILPIAAIPQDTPVLPQLPGIAFDGPEAIDGTYQLGIKEDLVRQQAALFGIQSMMMQERAANLTPVVIGDEIIINVSDSGAQTSYDETFKVVLIGAHGIILVTKEAYDSYDGTYYRFANPIGDDSSILLRSEDLLTLDQLSSLLSEFDNNIYPKDTSVFGESLPRGAEGQKVWILLHNIRDDAFYDSEQGTYIAGYFSASEDTENNKNMMHIDTYDWINRTGPDAPIPHLYEGVFAHEFEHLIHFDQDPNEPSWVDEGCADMAGYLCGYGHPTRHVMYYIALHPITSLTFWGGGLENYGASYLFMLYLYEKYGGDALISDLIREQADGIAGIEKALKKNGCYIPFKTLFNNWTIANCMDSCADSSSLIAGKYQYDSIQIGSADSGGYTIENALERIWDDPLTAAPFTIGSDWTGENPRPYTAHYIPYYNDKNVKLSIAGDIFTGVAPVSGNYEWYSEADTWAWRGISQTFEIPVSGATLSFKTYFEIEEDWDYGYVEVYDQKTGEWYTLESSATTNALPFPQDNPNVPEEREPATYFENGRWNAFTGVSGGWIDVNMDLSAFAGHTIEIYFKTWQDGASTLQMMYVDDIAIPEIGFYDDVESADHNWTVENWVRSNGKFPNSLSVLTLSICDPAVMPAPVNQCSNSVPKKFSLTVRPMKIDAKTQEGTINVERASIGGIVKHITIVTNHSDHILGAHYTLDAALISNP